MDSIAAWVGVVGGVAGIVVLVTGALVFVRGSYNKARIDALRADIGDYAQREAIHDREQAECASKISTLESRVQSLTSQNMVLQEAVTQKAAVDELKAESVRQHQELMTVMSGILSAIQRGQ